MSLEIEGVLFDDTIVLLADDVYRTSHISQRKCIMVRETIIDDVDVYC